jgi:phage-related protein
VVRPPSKGNKPTPPFGCAFYKTKNGAVPVIDWLMALDDDVRTQIGSDIDRVQWKGPQVGLPLVGSFGEGLYEVRTSFDGNIYRVLFCVHKGQLMLLHGFQKKTQKTPKDIIDLARKRQREVERSK